MPAGFSFVYIFLRSSILVSKDFAAYAPVRPVTPFQCTLSILVFSSPSILVGPSLEQGNRVGGISRQILRHVPMLNNACPLHPVNVRQRKRRLTHLIDTHVGEADIVVETLTEDYEWHIGNDCQRKPPGQHIPPNSDITPGVR